MILFVVFVVKLTVDMYILDIFAIRFDCRV